MSPADSQSVHETETVDTSVSLFIRRDPFARLLYSAVIIKESNYAESRTRISRDGKECRVETETGKPRSRPSLIREALSAIALLVLAHGLLFYFFVNSSAHLFANFFLMKSQNTRPGSVAEPNPTLAKRYCSRLVLEPTRTVLPSRRVSVSPLCVGGDDGSQKVNTAMCSNW